MTSISRPLLLCPTVFAVVFFGGLFYVLDRAKIEENTATTLPVPLPDASRQNAPREEKLPSLYLPECFYGEPGSEKSWEVSGYAAANFVSARALLTAWVQNQSWRPAKVIQLEAGLHPKLLLTFEKNGYELIVQLVRHSTDVTRFAYRRDKKQPTVKGLSK